MTNRRLVATAVATIISIAALVAVFVFPAQAATAPTRVSVPTWVRGSNGDCGGPAALVEDATVSVAAARFICLSGGPDVARVEFQIDGNPTVVETTPPYSLNAQAGWVPAVGPHVLRGRIVGRNGAVHSQYLTIHVVQAAASADPTPAATPSVIVAPTSSPPTTVAVTSPLVGAPPAPVPSTTVSVPTVVADIPAGVDFPGPTNTGVPKGTVLTPYTGPCVIRDNNVVIDSQQVDCGGMLVFGSGFVIRKSRVTGEVRTDSPTASMRIEDSEINAGSDHSEAVGLNHVVVLRSNITGDQHSVHCSDDCLVQDSWLHDQYDGRALGWHQQGFLTNGGSNFTLRHNTVSCVGRCNADVSLIPDDNISNVIVENNLLVASPDSGFCIYGGDSSGSKPGTATNIVIRNNVLQRGANGKCGFNGPVVYFRSGSGNQWTGNTFDDGTAVQPVD